MNQTIEVQVQAVMEYKAVLIPPDGSPSEAYEALSRELTELSRAGYAAQFSHAKWIIMAKIVGFTKLAADMGRIVLPVVGQGNRGH